MALVGRAEASLVGRRWEMAALDGHASTARSVAAAASSNVVGPPGIGKSRVAREAAALAAESRGRGVLDLLRIARPRYPVPRGGPVAAGEQRRRLISTATPPAHRLRAIVAGDADPQDLLLLDDLLGIADPDVALPQIDPDARRRRLTALINTASLARTEPALFIIEDAHWIDAVSESMLADLLAVIPRTPSMVLITSRPEYDGALTRVRGAQAIALAPLDDSDTAALIDELLGADPSVGGPGGDRSPTEPPETRSSPRRWCASLAAARRAAPASAAAYRLQRGRRRAQRARHGAGRHRGTHRPARARRPSRR